MSTGLLRVYLGAAPGVGTTVRMLEDGHRLAATGRDVVVGAVCTHGRAGTAARAAALESLAPHEGAPLDVAAVLARRPDVVLVDELSHGTRAGSGLPSRHAQVAPLLEAGIDVFATVSVGDLVSIADVIETITGVPPETTVPEEVLRAAEEVVLVDLSPHELRERVAAGVVVPEDQVAQALCTTFLPARLWALREIALRWLADRAGERRAAERTGSDGDGSWETRERVLVALTGSPGGDHVIRRAARIAARAGGELLGVHVRADAGSDDVPKALDSQRSLLALVGGTYREVVATSVSAGLLAVARAEGTTQVVLGATRRPRWLELLRGSVVVELVRDSGRDIDVHVVSAPDDAGIIPLPRPPGPGALGGRRRAAGFALAILGLVVITTALAPEAGVLGLWSGAAPPVAPEALTTPLLLYLALTATVAAVGGLWPGLSCAAAALMLANAVFTHPRGSLTVASTRDVVALVVFTSISILISRLADLVARRAAQTARAQGELRVLSRLAATIPVSDDPLERLTAEIRRVFELDGVSLVRSTADGRYVVECAAGDAPSHPDDADERLPVDAERLLLLRGSTSPAEDRRLLAAVVTQLAVASTRRSLTEATAALREVSAANDLRTALLSAVSHDLRTPLASIKASASSLLARDVQLSPELQEEFARAIVDDSDRLDRLVTNLLDMSRLQAGATDPLMAAAGLDEIVALSLERTPSHLVELLVPSDLPDVWADPALLERVLANLIENAVNASRGTPVVLWAGAEGATVVMRIIDRGPGIPPDAVEDLFKPFQRLGDAPRGRGVGLGLAIARGFADAMDVGLDVEQTPGGGTTMVLTLRTPPAVGTDAVLVGSRSGG